MDKLKIYLDRLKKADSEKLNLSVPPSFLGVEEESELSFPEEVHISGEVYLADEHLIVDLNLRTTLSLPCSVCNEPVNVPVDIDHHNPLALEELPSVVFDLSDEIREALLLQVPQFVECAPNGGCPEREAIKVFLKTPSKQPTSSSTTHFPFADLN